MTKRKIKKFIKLQNELLQEIAIININTIMDLWPMLEVKTTSAPTKSKLCKEVQKRFMFLYPELIDEGYVNVLITRYVSKYHDTYINNKERNK